MNAPGCVALILCWLVAWSTPPASGQGRRNPSQSAGFSLAPTAAPETSPEGLPEVSGTHETPTGNAAAAITRVPQNQPILVRPFSVLAIGVHVSLSGIGLDLATPLARRLNLRAGGSSLSIHPNFVKDDISILSDIHLRSAFVAIDLFPFNGAFHLSPGFTLYNGDHLSAKALVPGGQDFDLGNGTYTSDATDPVHGTFDLSFGKKTAPRLTLGWGNMIPRKGGHWSFPFEIGAEYIGTPPRITLTLVGTVCQGPGFCQPINQNPTAQHNVAIERSQINSDIPSWLRFSPLLSTGISYRFGHSPSIKR